MKDIIHIIVFVVTLFVIIGLGWIIGDIILDATNMVRTEDWIRCRIVIPLISVFVGVLVGGILADKVSNFFSK